MDILQQTALAGGNRGRGGTHPALCAAHALSYGGRVGSGAARHRCRFKLEFTQHAGSFKARGAFNNLLSRSVRPPAWSPPPAAIMASRSPLQRCAPGVPQPFLSHVASPVKIEQIRAYGATLQITGERYADALAASEEFARHSGALRVHAFDQLGNATGPRQRSAWRWNATALRSTHCWWRSAAADLNRRACRLVPRPRAGDRRGNPIRPRRSPMRWRPALRSTRRRRHCRGFAGAAPGRWIDVPIAQRFVAATVLVTDDAIRSAQRTLWNLLRVVVERVGGGIRRTAVRRVETGRRADRRRPAVRRQHRSREVRLAAGAGFAPPAAVVHSLTSAVGPIIHL